MVVRAWVPMNRPPKEGQLQLQIGTPRPPPSIRLTRQQHAPRRRARARSMEARQSSSLGCEAVQVGRRDLGMREADQEGGELELERSQRGHMCGGYERGTDLSAEGAEVGEAKVISLKADGRAVMGRGDGRDGRPGGTTRGRMVSSTRSSGLSFHDRSWSYRVDARR